MIMCAKARRVKVLYTCHAHEAEDTCVLLTNKGWYGWKRVQPIGQIESCPLLTSLVRRVKAKKSPTGTLKWGKGGGAFFEEAKP